MSFRHLVFILGTLAVVAFAGGAQAATPHLDEVEGTLRRLAPESQGRTWERTHCNRLTGGWGSWLVQTPDCWGSGDCRVPMEAYMLESAIFNSVANAKRLVDVTTLAHYPDGIYQDALVSGLRVALSKNPKLKIRVLAGSPPTMVISRGWGQKRAKAYWTELQRELGPFAEEAKIMVASVATKWAFSWNHAKMITVDGDWALVGGHNLWAAEYGEVPEPVSDVSMHLLGPAARSSHQFADELWSFACNNSGRGMNVAMYRSEALGVACLDNETAALPDVEEPARGNVDVLAVGGRGLGMETLDAGSLGLAPAGDSLATFNSWFSDYPNKDPGYSVANSDVAAIRALIESATQSVFLSQQDLIAPNLPPFSNSRYDARLFDILADKLIEGIAVRIVISTPLAKPYSDIASFREVSDILLRKVQHRARVSQGLAHAIVCESLQMAPIRITDGASTWGSGHRIANHAKVVMVDEEAFYIGSRNLYPTNLQDFGFMVEDARAATMLIDEYVDPMWNNSSWSAVVDFQTGACDV